MASRGILTNEEEIKSLKTELESLKTEMEEEVNGKMKPDIENKITRINRSIKKIEDILDGKTPMTLDLDMSNKRILNLPPPRDTEESAENYNDSVTVKYLYDLMKDIAGKIDKRYLKKEGRRICIRQYFSHKTNWGDNN